MNRRPTSPARRTPRARPADGGAAARSAAGTPDAGRTTPGSAAKRTPAKSPAAKRTAAQKAAAEKAVVKKAVVKKAVAKRTAKKTTAEKAAATAQGTTTGRPVVSTTSVRRFSERARAQRLMPWRRVAWVAAALAVLSLVAWVLLASPLLTVRTVEVTGTRLVPAAEVEALVDDARGVPLARVGTSELQQRVERLTVVHDATIQRSWPSTLRVVVAERVPIAVVPAEGRFEVVDDEGVVLAVHDEAPEELPVVQVDVGAAGGRTVLEAVETLRALPGEIRDQVVTVSAATRDSVTLTLANDSEVFWGSADESEQKVAVLRVLLQTSASVYDVSAPDTPVTR